MDHDRFPSDPVDDVPDPGVALYLFTILATELLLGRPPATPPTHSAPDRPEPEQPPMPGPTARQQSTERHQPSDPRQASERYQPRPDAEQRDLSQALLRVVSALAHLGATARTYTATPTTPARPAPPPDPHRTSRPRGADRQRRRWITAAAITVALGVAFRPRRHRPSADRRHCAGCGH